MKSSLGPVSLLTGATGLVGGELLPSLAARPGARVVALTRQRDRIPQLSRLPAVTALEADITKPQLGLDDGTIAELCGCVTEIIHCAAETRFGLPLEQARLTNAQGTAHLLELARRCHRLQKFAHLSTVYVVGRTTGRLPEAPASPHNGFTNTYQESKYEAEQLVVSAMGELPAAIFRCSSIIGDSITGRVRQFNYVHQLLRLLPQNVLPVAPGDPAAPVDLIPTDWAIAALRHLFENRFVPGRIFQVCAGPEGSLTVRQMIDLTVEIFEAHPIGRQLGPIRLPELVSLHEYEKYVEESRRGGDRLLNELLRVLGHFLPHLGLFQAFENRNVMEGLAGSGIHLPPIRTYYGKVVGYCLETRWGRRAQ